MFIGLTGLCWVQAPPDKMAELGVERMALPDRDWALEIDHQAFSESMDSRSLQASDKKAGVIVQPGASSIQTSA